MKRTDLDHIAMLVRTVGDRVQPLLEPHPGLAARNAHAHIWLGIKTLFGISWRERAHAAQVVAFIRWIELNPNAEYAEYIAPITLKDPEQGLFGFLEA